jgi:hypothetical protein
VFYDSKNEMLKIVEVKETHATKPQDRPTKSAEVTATQVRDEWKIHGTKGNAYVVLHNLFPSTETCIDCKVERERKLALLLKRELKMAEEKKARERQLKVAEACRRQLKMAEEEKAREREAAKMAEEEKERCERERVAAALCERQQQVETDRANAAVKFEVQPTTGFRASYLGTASYQNVSQDDIEQLRRERMDRKAATK